MKEYLKNQTQEVINTYERIMRKYKCAMAKEVREKTVGLSIIRQGEKMVKVIVNDPNRAIKYFQDRAKAEDNRWIDYDLDFEYLIHTEKLNYDSRIQVIFNKGKIDNIYLNNYKDAWNEFTTRKQEDDFNSLAFVESGIEVSA
ncbi:MAG: hypothetical protein ACRCVJ_18530 [Clostridium sp.]|uniref:hypothetical protein n=1 Tax=Clostridium sp. TaxID=1506 RepID=UPI003F3995F1